MYLFIHAFVLETSIVFVLWHVLHPWLVCEGTVECK
jgi:hypothetical protein